jgi:hypothetical protein
VKRAPLVPGHKCGNPACRRRVRSEYFACFTCWRELPAELRAEVLATWRELQDATSALAYGRSQDDAARLQVGTAPDLSQRIERRRRAIFQHNAAKNAAQEWYLKEAPLGGLFTPRGV